MAFNLVGSWYEVSETAAAGNANRLHHAVDMRVFTADLTGSASGVASATALKVTEKAGTPNMSVDVAVGGAFVASTRSVHQGVYHGYNPAVINVVIAASNPTDPRIDRILARVKDSAQDAAFVGIEGMATFVVQGTPNATPVAPTITIEDWIEIAQVTVGAGVSSITNANITDKRHVVVPKQVKFTSSGSFAKADFPGIKAVRVRLVAGGGAGGGPNATGAGQASIGSGGGGGAYGESIIPVTSLGASETVTRGAGGTAVAGGSGLNGGTSSFGAHVSADGGIGGLRTAAGSGSDSRLGGDGGSTGTANILIPGSDGGNAAVVTAVGTFGGFGGSSALGGSRNPAAATGVGLDGKNYGGGGSGGFNGASQAARAGGAGAPGIVIVDLIY